MSTLNLGILAHVDAGKTTLTERLLHAVGVIDEVGRVDDGSTQTDTLALERRRGITIKSAVASFAVDDVAVNLIDTPGHPDFIAEVERVLAVLDGAVLVVSAVEGVQAQTRVLMRTLSRLRIPTLVFVNKIDRIGARHDAVVESIAAKLAPSVIAMGSVREGGTRRAVATPYDDRDGEFRTALLDRLTEHDDELLTEYVDGESVVSYPRLRDALVVQTRRAAVHPVFFGSAVTGTGVESLIRGVRELLAVPVAPGDGPISGAVFKIERGVSGEKIAYTRLFSGTVRTRDRVRIHRPDGRGWNGRVTAISVFEPGGSARREVVVAGQIAKVWGLFEIQVGDTIGVPPDRGVHHFAPPSLETVVVARRPEDRARLHAALVQLAEQDPLIGLRQDVMRRETSVSLYGEVQREVIQETLSSDFGVDVTFSETTTLCVERPIGVGTGVETIATEPNPFLATVGLRVGAASADSGVTFQLAGVLHGTMPPAFFTAVEEAVKRTLDQGLYGWQVTDCTVTMTHSGYWARQSHAHGTFDKSMSSTAGDFRDLTPLVLMNALRAAATAVYEPIHHFRLELPSETIGPVLAMLPPLRAVPHAPVVRGPICVLEGELPAAQVHRLGQQLPAATRGEGVVESAFHHYGRVCGRPPTRPRTDHNPLNRDEYLRHVLRRT